MSGLADEFMPPLCSICHERTARKFDEVKYILKSRGVPVKGTESFVQYRWTTGSRFAGKCDKCIKFVARRIKRMAKEQNSVWKKMTVVHKLI